MFDQQLNYVRSKKSRSINILFVTKNNKVSAF